MAIRVGPFVLAAAVLGAGAFALLRPGPTPPTAVEPARELPAAPTSEPALDPRAGLPPNHPPIGDTTAAPAPAEPADGQGAAITWQVPEHWQVAPNPSRMRLATYRIPGAPHEADGAEMSVARAGGTTDANVERWVGQFQDAASPKRADRSVRGLKVTVVEIGGTYRGGGMMPGAPPAQHSGWTLLAAIVEAPGSSYFFKLIGPEATVRAARPSFDALVASITPKQ